MDKNLSDFIEYLQDQVDNGSIYVYGAQGQKAPVVNERWIRKMERDTGGTIVSGHYKSYANIAVTAWKKKVEAGYGDVLRAFDCSGLGTYFFLKHGLIDHDKTANGLMGLCKTASEPKAGFWVFRTSNGRATHIGYMVSDTELVEAKGRAYGAVKREYNPKEWNRIGKPKIFDFKPEPGEKKIRVKGSVRVREGNGVNTKKICTVKNCLLPYLGQAATDPFWYMTEVNGRQGYITSNKRYTELVEVNP